jgi:hypothetical protein
MKTSTLHRPEPRAEGPLYTCTAIPALSLIFIPFAHGDARTSQSYTVTAESIGPSGSRVSSAEYTLDLSAAPTVAGQVSDGNPYIGKLGFVGQLYETVSLSVSADPATVDEASTRQMAATATLDDATLLAVDPSKVDWSVDSGPLTSVSGSGLAIADTVYADSDAVVAAAYQGEQGQLTVTVLNVNSDDFGTYAQDGLPDEWQVEFFGEDNAQADPLSDPDADRLVNLSEFGLGSDPTNRLSGLGRIPGPTLDPDGGSEEFLTIAFKRRPAPAAVTYVVEVSADLATWTAAQQVGNPSLQDGDGLVTVTYRDTVSMDQAAGPRFIRVEIAPTAETSGD